MRPCVSDQGIFPGGLVKERIFLPMQETRVAFLGREDPLEEGMATHSNILAWRTPWREEPGGLQFMGHKESDTTVGTQHKDAFPPDDTWLLEAT